jgi:hypothetical protein
MTPHSRKLRDEANATLAAADAAATPKPLRGTQEWNCWRVLCRKALDANGAYLQELRTELSNS